MSLPINHCPVCGFNTDESYTSVYELRFSYNICACCDCEYGYDDNLKFYNEWVKDGCIWFEKRAKPEDWKLEDQIQNQIRPWPPE